MLPLTPHGYALVTTHTLERYRQRIDALATLGAVLDAFAAARPLYPRRRCDAARLRALGVHVSDADAAVFVNKDAFVAFLCRPLHAHDGWLVGTALPAATYVPYKPRREQLDRRRQAGRTKGNP